jgi:hypothetical protein
LSPSKKSPHVPAQYYGYSLQCTQCVYVLLDAQPGASVSVEVLDDVAVEESFEEVEAIQLKSALKTNPISNRSVDFWKTIGNWIRAVEKGELDVGKTIFHLRLGRKRSGAICESFADASSLETATAAIEKAKDQFFTPKGKLKAGISGELRGEVETFFAPARAELVRHIVTRFRVSFGTRYAYDGLLNHIKTKLIDDDVAEDVLLHALGWVKKEIDIAVEADRPPIIAADGFRAEVRSFRDRLEARNYLPSFAGPPSLEQIELHKLRVFVRQLNLIGSAGEDVLSGITDFLSAVTNRVEYARRGYVNSESFSEFEEALESLWKNHRNEVELNVSEDEVTRGRRVAFRCLREMVKLQGIEVPANFVRGCFHTLADQPRIGWHPRYKTLLGEVGGG